MTAGGATEAEDGSGGAPTDGGWGGDAGPWETDGEVVDCTDVYNPSRILNYEFRMAESDWEALTADATNSVYFSAEMRCGGGTPLTVGLRRKRSGGTTKVGLKVDVNWSESKQSFSGLKKLSLENGISEGDSETTAENLLSEFLAWRLMTLSGAVAGRGALAHVRVNDVDLGIYVNVEQVDKRFLSDRLGDDSGWLYKKSGNDDDGYKTNEGELNPHASYFCFWERPGCPVPGATELATTLPEHLDIPQLLRLGAVNALIANTDTLLQKDNNYIFYDADGRKRMYFPWDLDTTMRSDFDPFSGTVPGGTSKYTDVLFSNWLPEYDDILTELVEGPLALEVILGELDAILDVAGPALDADPWLAVGDDGERLRTWWTTRHASVVASVAAR